MAQAEDQYEDPRRRRDGSVRVFELVMRMDPQGETPPYWSVVSMDNGRVSTIREDRLPKYRALG